jgi:organic hydroperoxide reductase OsmC/OhrA
MQVDVQLRSLPGTEAAVGWAGGHAIVADRPEGKAGGQGLGFNGGQLLALALGGCFCNDLRYVAEKLGVRIGEISVDVQLDLAGEPLVATSARMSVDCKMADGSDSAKVIEQAKSSCFVSNTLMRGVSVNILVAG